MRKSITSLTLVSVMILISSCANKAALQPGWVNGVATDYPAKKYLTGKGQSTNQDIARDRARSDLAKIFEVSISEQSYDYINYTSKKEGGKKVVQMDSETGRDINAQTEQIVSGIRISEIWQQPKSKIFHILATLDRFKAANSLRQEISQLDTATAQVIQYSRKTSDPLQQLGFANKALQLQLKRVAFEKHLKVLNYTGMGLSSSYNIAVLVNDRNKLLQRIKISVQIESDPIGGLNDIVAGNLSNAGFTHVKDKQPDYVLSGKLSLENFVDKKGWNWQRGTLEINLLDPVTKKSLGTQRWPVKVSSQNKATSQKRVLDKINVILNKELRKSLVQFASAR